ncbi:helix-turn-helix domain-containing protein [Streptomyces lunaelactis]|uniref:GlxA family transcriptional regulator n=1 Tax=Streptomyces lunaelactis TaxID=1535768 RepID=UPI001584F4C0|nr:helix-turn-helix domain-containing protein [Streptomyces lunaelactis]NUK01375.1 helix-turn-helix domain-containing protein [Streptomyces lunaelactis]NUK08773.1 helix-turn-helix domain-containing protein [Streptomyces lunaelactis]NUK15314.1 helix-turn-helix domain-containing protein [Streptomyces lunaelactis]NUK32667.1 helix-turn-helix domain-containing protein [Streptomyces lunaelactis]NUK40899.1 helix-turn-helix domain-containing protein [Streptomyces lunaelactis]
MTSSEGLSSAVHTVAVLILDRVLTFDLGIPLLVFNALPDEYQVVLCTPEPGVVPTYEGFSLNISDGLDAATRADTLIVPGYDLDRPLPQAALRALRRARAEGTRLVSICTGAFALAEAGLLDGLTATTHWREAERLAERYRAVTVDRDVLYVDEGQILTSAGASAGVDLCLHLVGRDHGAAVANSVARLAVAAPHRTGGQSQYIERSVPHTSGQSLAATREWALHNIAGPLSVRRLADHASLSERTFARHFVEETGMPPLQWLLTARIDLAKHLLETGDHGVDEVARRVGLGTAANLRLRFRRATGTSPSSYRRTFTRR